MPTPKPPRAYSWELEESAGSPLCHWALPNLKALKNRRRPSPGAKVVAVRIVRESEYRVLLKAKRDLDTLVAAMAAEED